MQQVSADHGSDQTVPLPLGALGDVAAARAVARHLLLKGDRAVASFNVVLPTLILTALCLRAAELTDDVVFIADLERGVSDLGTDGGGSGLQSSPMQFVRYAGSEFADLPAEVARSLLADLQEALRPG